MPKKIKGAFIANTKLRLRRFHKRKPTKATVYSKQALGPGCGRGSGVRAWKRWHAKGGFAQ